ncbi:MAG: DHA2 family efflux MFS transporter permease subunit [Thermomicrobiales bacterium]
MSSIALSPVAVPRTAINPWVIAGIVVIPTFMEILDTTIANVALRYISGGLSAAQADSEWVITSYLAANAIVLPITGWLSSHLGRRNYFLLSVAIFTLSSAACGFATSLAQMILFRIIQGLSGGGLQPCSQGILMDSFPEEKQGTAMTLFGLAAIIAPVVGPTLGGWLCVSYNWRWIFLINVPIGLLALVGSFAVVEDPDYLKQERAEIRRKPFSFDYIGLSVLVLVMCSWEIMLSKGREWDWLGDPYGRLQTLLIMFLLGLVFLVVWEMRCKQPIIDFRCLGERNFAVCCVIFFLAFAVIYCASMTLPKLLQALFNYDALVSGLAMSPSGVSSMIAMMVAGFLLGRQFDARWMIAAGLLAMAVGNYWMVRMNLEVSFWHVIWPRMVLTLGLGLIFAPASVAAYKYIPPHLRGAAVGMFSLLRTEGGSVGTTMSQTILEPRQQFHLSRIGENLGPLNPQVDAFLKQTQQYYQQWTGDAAQSQQLAVQTLDSLRQQQAAALAFFDIFWICAVVSLALVPLVFLMKRSVAEKGERISAE